MAEHYEIDFDIIFRLKAAQNLVGERYERNFNIIFHLMVAQNWVPEHYERGKVDWPCSCGDEQK